MVLVNYPTKDMMPALISAVDVSQLGTRDYSGYRPQSGTITYTLYDGTTHLTLELVVGADTTLWNKVGGQRLSDPLTATATSGSTNVGSVSSVGIISGTYYTDPLHITTISTSRMIPASDNANFKFKLSAVLLRRTHSWNYSSYFPELKITFALPLNTTKNTYATFNKDDLEFPVLNKSGVNELDPKTNRSEGFSFTATQNNTDHTVTLTWKNVYVDAYDAFYPVFGWAQGQGPAEGDVIVWQTDSLRQNGTGIEGGTDSPLIAAQKSGTTSYAVGSVVAGSYKCINDTTEYPFVNLGARVTEARGSMVVCPEDSLTLSGNARNLVNLHTTHPDDTYTLGFFLLINNGSKASAPKTLQFDYMNTDVFGVTAQRIPAGTGNRVTVKYRTTAAPETERTYSGTLTAADGHVLFTAGMAGLGANEYFTKIEAEVGSYPIGYMNYNELRDMRRDRGCVVYGKSLVDDSFARGSDRRTQLCKLTLADTDNPANKKSFTVTVHPQGDYDMVSTGFAAELKAGTTQSLPVLSKTVAEPGDTVHVNAVLSVLGSGTSDLTRDTVDDPVIYLRFPAGVEVKNVALTKLSGRTSDSLYNRDHYAAFLKNTGTVRETSLTRGSDFKVSNAIPQGNAWNVYVITFVGEKGRVGWSAADLSQDELRLSFDLGIANNIDAEAFNLRDCVFAKSATRTGALDSNNNVIALYQVADTYGLSAISLNNITLLSESTAAAANEALSIFSVNNTELAMSIKAPRGGNDPVVTVGVNGGTAATGTSALMYPDESGKITMPVAPVKSDKEFDCWVASDGNTYQPGDRVEVTDNLAMAAKWKGEAAPTPDASNPFAYALNESGVNYGGSAASINADRTGEVPAAVAQRADAAAGIESNDNTNVGDDSNANSDDGPGTNMPGDEYLDNPGNGNEGPGPDEPGDEDPNGNGNEPGDDPNGRTGDEGPNGDGPNGDGAGDPNGNDPNGAAGDGNDDPNGAAGDGDDGPNGAAGDNGTGQGDPTGGATRIGGNTGGSTSTISGGKGFDTGGPLARTGDNAPIAVILCIAGVALLLASLVLFRMQARARLTEATDGSTGHAKLCSKDDENEAE